MQPDRPSSPESPESPALRNIDHVHIHVRDRAAASRWYAQVLGLETVEALAHWAVDGGPLTLGNAGDTVHVALFERPPQPCHSTIAFGVSGADYAAWRARLQPVFGAALEEEDHGPSRSLYFHDPDGNPFEITTYEVADAAEPAGIHAEAALQSDADFAALERRRLAALVGRDMALARALHADDFQLVTPRGTTYTRDAYLAAVDSGELRYRRWQAQDIAVRRFDRVALLRYAAELVMGDADSPAVSLQCWHTDSYELRDGRWQIVWSQATRLVP